MTNSTPSNISVFIRFVVTILLGLIILWGVFYSLALLQETSNCGNGVIPADPKTGFAGFALLLPILYLFFMDVIWLYHRKNLENVIFHKWYMKIWVQITAGFLFILAYFITAAILFQHLFDGFCF